MDSTAKKQKSANVYWSDVKLRNVILVDHSAHGASIDLTEARALVNSRASDWINAGLADTDNWQDKLVFSVNTVDNPEQLIARDDLSGSNYKDVSYKYNGADFKSNRRRELKQSVITAPLQVYEVERVGGGVYGDVFRDFVGDAAGRRTMFKIFKEKSGDNGVALSNWKTELNSAYTLQKLGEEQVTAVAISAGVALFNSDPYFYIEMEDRGQEMYKYIENKIEQMYDEYCAPDPVTKIGKNVTPGAYFRTLDFIRPFTAFYLELFEKVRAILVELNIHKGWFQNDLHLHNVLYNEATDQITIIDYSFAHYLEPRANGTCFKVVSHLMEFYHLYITVSEKLFESYATVRRTLNAMFYERYFGFRPQYFSTGIDEVESPELLGVLEACYAMYVAEGQKKRMAGLTNFLIVYGAALLKDFKPLLNTRRTDEQLAEAIADRVLEEVDLFNKGNTLIDIKAVLLVVCLYSNSIGDRIRRAGRTNESYIHWERKGPDEYEDQIDRFMDLEISSRLSIKYDLFEQVYHYNSATLPDGISSLVDTLALKFLQIRIVKLFSPPVNMHPTDFRALITKRLQEYLERGYGKDKARDLLAIYAAKQEEIRPHMNAFVAKRLSVVPPVVRPVALPVASKCLRCGSVVL